MGLALILDARCDIDPVAKDVVAVDDDIANVYSDPEQDTRPTPSGRSLRHFLLNLDRAGHGIDGARKLNSTSMPSSVVLTMRRLWAVAGSTISRRP